MERTTAAREKAIWFRGGDWEQRWIIPNEEFGDDPLPGLEDYYFLEHGNIVFLPKKGSYFEEYDPINDETDLFLHFAKLGESIYEQFRGYWLTYDLSQHFLQFKENSILAEIATPFLERFGHPTIPVGHALSEAPEDNIRGPLTSETTILKEFAFTGQKFYEATAFNMFEQAQYVNMAVQYIRVMANDSNINYLRKLVDSRLARLPRPAQHVKRRVEIDPDGGIPRIVGGQSESEVAREVERLYGVREHSDPALVMAEAIIAAQVNSHGGIGGGDVSLELVHTPRIGSTQDWQFLLRYDTLLNVIWYQVAKALIEGSAFRTCQNERCQRPSRLFRPSRLNQTYCGKTCRDAQGAREYRSRKSQSAASKNLKDLLP